VAADRADDFDRFLRDAVFPAVEAGQPHLSGRWRALRASAANGDVLTYVFLFDGGELERDWDLGPLFAAHFGEEEAERYFQQWDEMTVPVRRWADGFTEESGSGQIGWTCSPVSRIAT
jgi:hypothetical protein